MSRSISGGSMPPLETKRSGSTKRRRDPSPVGVKAEVGAGAVKAEDGGNDSDGDSVMTRRPPRVADTDRDVSRGGAKKQKVHNAGATTATTLQEYMRAVRAALVNREDGARVFSDIRNTIGLPGVADSFVEAIKELKTAAATADNLQDALNSYMEAEQSRDQAWAEADKLKGRIKQLEATNAELNRNNAALIEQKAGSSIAVEQRLITQAVEIERLLAQVKLDTEALARLRFDNARLVAEKGVLDQAVGAAQATSDRLQGQRDLDTQRYKAEVANLNTEIRRLQNELNRRQDTNDSSSSSSQQQIVLLQEAERNRKDVERIQKDFAKLQETNADLVRQNQNGSVALDALSKTTAAAADLQVLKLDKSADQLKKDFANNPYAFVTVPREAIMSLVRYQQSETSAVYQQLSDAKTQLQQQQQRLLEAPQVVTAVAQPLFDVAELPNGTDIAKRLLDPQSTALELVPSRELQVASRWSVDPQRFMLIYGRNMKQAVEHVDSLRRAEVRAIEHVKDKLEGKLNDAEQAKDKATREALLLQSQVNAAEADADSAKDAAAREAKAKSEAETKLAAEAKNAKRAAAAEKKAMEEKDAAEKAKRDAETQLKQLSDATALALRPEDFKAVIATMPGADLGEFRKLAEPTGAGAAGAVVLAGDAERARLDFAKKVLEQIRKEREERFQISRALAASELNKDVGLLARQTGAARVEDLHKALQMATGSWKSAMIQLERQQAQFANIIAGLKQSAMDAYQAGLQQGRPLSIAGAAIPKVVSAGTRRLLATFAGWDEVRLHAARVAAQAPDSKSIAAPDALNKAIDDLTSKFEVLKIKQPAAQDGPSRLIEDINKSLALVTQEAAEKTQKLQNLHAARSREVVTWALHPGATEQKLLEIEAPRLQLALEAPFASGLISPDEQKKLLVKVEGKHKLKPGHKYALEAVYTPRADLAMETSSHTRCWLECCDWDLNDIVDRSGLRGGKSPRLSFGGLLTDVSESFVLRTRVLPVVAVMAALRGSENDALLAKIGMPSPGRLGGATALLNYFAQSHASGHMLHAQRFAAEAFPDVREGRIALDDAVGPSLLRTTEAMIECEAAAVQCLILRRTFIKTQDPDDLLGSCLCLATVAINMDCNILDESDKFDYVGMLCRKWQKVFAQWAALVLAAPDRFEQWEVELAKIANGPLNGQWALKETNQAVLASLAMADLRASLAMST